MVLSVRVGVIKGKTEASTFCDGGKRSAAEAVPEALCNLF